jgi:hypothetical protein
VYFAKNPTKTMFENSVETGRKKKKELYGYQKAISMPYLSVWTMLKAASLIPVAYRWRKNSCVLRDRASLFVKEEVVVP